MTNEEKAILITGDTTRTLTAYSNKEGSEKRGSHSRHRPNTPTAKA